MSLTFKLFLSSLVLIILGQTSQVAFLRMRARSVAEPLSYGASRFGRNLSEQASFFRSLGNTFRENRRLGEEILALKSQLSHLKELERENKLLKEQLGSKVQEKGDLVAVRVQGWEDFGKKDTLLIKGGENLGLKPGMTVLIKNFLLGRIERVGKETSSVRLILSPELGIFALDQDSKDRTRGIVRGFPPGRLLMERILPEEEVVPGDIIISSGAGGEFPPGLILGLVEKVIPEEGEILKRAILRLEVDIAHLEEVFVLRGD